VYSPDTGVVRQISDQERPMTRVALGGLLAVTVAGALAQQPSPSHGVRLADLSWTQAAPLLDPSAVVVFPLGAAASEHGPHLKLNTDQRLANYLTSRVLAAASIVVAPALTYHYYPAFVEYPGSISLSLGTARAMTLEAVRSIARSGPRRFYVLNTGASTVKPLQDAAAALGAEGILMQFTDLEATLAPAVKRVQQQPGGSHADEIETSMLLYVDAASVEMSKAGKDYSPTSTTGPLTRRRGAPGIYSPSGIVGDATLATPEKGRELVETLVAGILADLDRLRNAPLPVASPVAPSRAPLNSPQEARTPPAPADCTPGDLRAIRNIGVAFTAAWANKDAQLLSNLWARDGDVRHPDGTIERGAIIIRENRSFLFRQRAYQGSKHPVTLYDVRCLGYDVAIADGKWELREVTDAKGAPSNYAGLCTLIVRRSGPESTWSIEAWRYTIDAPSGPPPPTVLKRPGWPG
jgi:creatinine amidohydrolase